MAKQFSSIKHPLLKFSYVPLIIFLAQSLEIFVCVTPETSFNHFLLIFCYVFILGPARAFFTILLKWACVPLFHFSRVVFYWFNKSIFDPALDTLYFNI